MIQIKAGQASALLATMIRESQTGIASSTESIVEETTTMDSRSGKLLVCPVDDVLLGSVQALRDAIKPVGFCPPAIHSRIFFSRMLAQFARGSFSLPLGSPSPKSGRLPSCFSSLRMPTRCCQLCRRLYVPPMLIVLDWAGLNVVPTDAHPSALHSKICPVTYLVPELIIELTFYKCLLQKEVTGPLTMPNANFSARLSRPTLKEDRREEQPILAINAKSLS